MPLGRGERVPVELRIGDQLVDVWLDAHGIHFSQPEAASAEGHLPWEDALALALVPAERRRAPRSA